MSLSSDKSWVNTAVGSGYQASGVVRQRKLEPTAVKILDMRGPQTEPGLQAEGVRDKKRKADDEKHRDSHQNDKKKRKEKKKKKHNKRSKMDDEESASLRARGFNPLLQLLASRISARPREFTLANAQ